MMDSKVGASSPAARVSRVELFICTPEVMDARSGLQAAPHQARTGLGKSIGGKRMEELATISTPI